MDKEQLITEIIDCGFEVSQHLKPGYLESVYEKALMVELTSRGIRVNPQQELVVEYKGECVGLFKADLIVENCVIIEIKATEEINVKHEIQLVNYLTITGIDDGLLMNFGASEFKVRRKFRQYRPAGFHDTKAY